MAADDSDMPLDALTPDPQNARSHDSRNLGLIAEALRDVGAARSIVVDEHGTVLAGNATVQAATLAGLSRVRIIDADGSELIAVRRRGLSPDQKTRLALYDNRAAELAVWDTEVLATLADEVDLSALWDSDELADLLGQEREPVALLGDPNDVPDLPADPMTQAGDLWLLGSHRLLCGDCTNPDDVARLMAGEQASCLWTDPPYGVSYTGRTTDALTIANDDDAGLAGLLTAAFTTVGLHLREGAAFTWPTRPVPSR